MITDLSHVRVVVLMRSHSLSAAFDVHDSRMKNLGRNRIIVAEAMRSRVSSFAFAGVGPNELVEDRSEGLVFEQQEIDGVLVTMKLYLIHPPQEPVADERVFESHSKRPSVGTFLDWWSEECQEIAHGSRQPDLA